MRLSRVLPFCLLIAAHSAQAQEFYQYLRTSPTAGCPAGSGIEWRVNWMGNGQYLPLGITPIGDCFWLSGFAYYHWAHGWFENRCVSTTGAAPGPWGQVDLPGELGAIQDGGCQGE